MMLCEFAQSFPPFVAALLERDRGIKRNFREETVTDLLMAGLVGLEAFGIRVDFPDEPTTGGDMEWIYAAPLEVGGGRYLRLVLQAKRAMRSRSKAAGYWYYRELAHGDPAGQQAQTLVAHASTSPDGKATLPLYIFYHPTSALAPAAHGRPAVEGVNLVFAHHVALTVDGGCTLQEKKVSFWRDRFMPLSEVLCWPALVTDRRSPDPAGATLFLTGPVGGVLRGLTGGFHPDLVARRFREQRERLAARAVPGARAAPPLEPADGIPAEIRRAIEGDVTKEDRKRLQRPRAILATTLRREDPDFPRVDRLTRRGG